MQSSVENQSSKNSNRIAFITILVVFSVFILLSISLSSVALSKSLNNTAITPTLQTLGENTQITSQGCLSASCFTDNFVKESRQRLLSDDNGSPHYLKSSALRQRIATDTFSVSKGNIICETISTSKIDIKGSIMDSLGLTFEENDQSSLFSASTLHFTSGSNTLMLNQSGVQSDTNFKMEANVVVVDKTFQLGGFTTTQRLDLNPQDGTLVYDNTIGSMASFQSGSWVLLSNSTGLQTLQVIAGELVKTGPVATPTIGLATTSITSGVYIAPTVTFDSFGRATNAISHPNTVTDLTVLAGQLVNTGTSTEPILGLANVNNSDGDYTWPNLTVDNQGRITNIAENPVPILSVTGTTNEINVTSGSNPIISLNASLLSSIQFWETLEPSGIPSQLQFLQYQGTKLEWVNVGTGSFPVSRNIYVDKSGNDTIGTGSNISPFLTIAKAISIANAGDTSDSNQVAIYVGAGIYFELNPIAITVSGINIIGSSAIGTWIAPADPTSTLLSMTNGIVTFDNCLFQAIPTTSTAPCMVMNGTFTLYLTSCSFRFFQSALICNGVNTNDSAGIFNNCIFVENGTSCTLSAGTIIMGNSQIIGSLSGTSTHDGFIIDSIDSLLFVGGGTSFLSCALALSCSNQSKSYLSAINFTNNIINIKALSGSVIRGVGCNLVIMDTNYISVYVSDPTSQIKLNSCSIDGLSALNVQSGTGCFVTNQGNLSLQACDISNCATGLLIGVISDTASTICSCTNSNFSMNIVSVDLDGTSTFNGTFLNVDDHSTLIFDSTTNVNLVFSDPDIGLNIGTLTNETTSILGFATKLTGASSLVYNPNVYNQEALLYVNPDVTKNISLGTVSQLDSHHGILSTVPNGVCGIRMYTDLSNFDGSQIRGWHIYKSGTSGILNFDYDNNITGQPTVVGKLMMQLDSVNNSVFMASNIISWTNGTNLYEASTGVLKTDNNFAIGGLTANCAIVTDTNKQLVSSPTTSTQLGYLSTTTSDVQVQLTNKINKSGDTMTGALNSSYVGTASQPNFAVNNAGIYSSAGSNLSLATNNQNRVNINSSGNVSILEFVGAAGVVKNDVNGQLFSVVSITGSDISASTIPNSKLSELSSANTASNLVQRDVNGSFFATMITLSGTPMDTKDVATKGYVDGVAGLGLVIKDPVLVVSVTPISSPPTGPQTIDGVVLVTGNRVLLVAQAIGEEKYNGAWVANTAGIWTRPTDFASGSTAATAYFLVTSGTSFIGSSWACVTPMATVDTDALEFSQFSLPQDINGSNLGSGTGLVFESSVGTTLNFNSLLSLNNLLTITNSGSGEIDFDIKTSSSNTVSTIVSRDSSGNFAASNITATNFFGLASLNLALTGNQTVSGPVVFSNGTFALPNVAIGSADTGISNLAGVLQFSTAGTLRLSIDASGIVNIGSLNTNGVVHANSSILSSSKIVDADITLGTITNASLASISSTNVPGNIVVRDGSGNFAANVITAGLIGNVTGNVLGNVTGHASLDLALTGGTMSGPLIGFAGNFALPGLAIGDTLTGLSYALGSLQFSTSGVSALSINSSGTIFMPLLLTQGVMHIAASGLVQVSQVSNSEIASGAVTDAKITGPLTTALLVSNSATTATSANTALAIVARDVTGNFAAGTITANLSGNATSANSFSGSLVGDVTGTQSATVVSLVGGVTSANIVLGVNLANGATSSLGINTIVKRDGSNNFVAGTITANLSGNATTATSSTSFSGSLVGDVTGTQSATVVALVGGVTSTNVALGVNLANGATSALGINTIVKRDGSNNFSAGTITANLSGNATTANSFSGSLVGDVTGTQSATVVALVGGVTSANIVLGVNLANDATSSLGINTIVKRDGSNNFAAGTITANLTGSASLNVLKSGDTMSGLLTLQNGLALTGGDIDDSGDLSIGAGTATSLTLGHSAITTLVNGTFASTVYPRGAFYTTTSFSAAFPPSATPIYLAPPTVTSGTLDQFTQTVGQFTYAAGGARTRSFCVTYNITFLSGSAGANMTFFIAVGTAGTPVLGTGQASIFEQITTGKAAAQTSLSITDIITLTGGQIFRLAASCATNVSITFNRLSCVVSALMN
jgi:hypothetical protein